MLHNKNTLWAITTLIVTCCPAVYADDFKVLGHPLGKFLVIEGEALTSGGKVGTKTLKVTKVNGEELDHASTIWVQNVDTLPADTAIILRGFVSGEYIGIPHEVLGKENLPVPQAVFQFRTYFVATSVVKPADLNLFERKTRTWQKPIIFDAQGNQKQDHQHR